MAQTKTIAVIGAFGIILLGLGLFLYFTDAPPQDLSMCAEIQDMHDKATCYMFVASAKKNISMCDSFESKIDRDICSSMISNPKDELPLHVEIMIIIGVILIIAAILDIFLERRKSEDKKTDEDIADVIKNMGWGIIIFGFIILLLASFGYLLYYLYADDTTEKNINEAFNFTHDTYLDSSGYTWHMWTYKYYYISTKKINAIALFGVLLLIFGAVLLLLSSHWLSGIYQADAAKKRVEVGEVGEKAGKTGIVIDKIGETTSEGVKSIDSKLEDITRINSGIK